MKPNLSPKPSTLFLDLVSFESVHLTPTISEISVGVAAGPAFESETATAPKRQREISKSVSGREDIQVYVYGINEEPQKATTRFAGQMVSLAIQGFNQTNHSHMKFTSAILHNIFLDYFYIFK
ncbi:unnamed protein product [Citrullus colocynthis]|uniref:Uncharacterized protein n=1 Tax=Citrullus colocynthis TaxID=252529 RepID=A0ABP0ZAM7_9ROSI